MPGKNCGICFNNVSHLYCDMNKHGLQVLFISIHVIIYTGAGCPTQYQQFWKTLKHHNQSKLNYFDARLTDSFRSTN